MTENNDNQKQSEHRTQHDKKKDDVVVSTPDTDINSEKKDTKAAAHAASLPRSTGRREKAHAIKGAPYCKAYIQTTFNNTIVSITDMAGNVVAWSSAGKIGFSGSRKSTAYAGGLVGEDAAKQALAKGLRIAEVYVQGPGAGRESAIRAIQSAGLNITLIKDITPIPHNGCRPRKRRRV